MGNSHYRSSRGGPGSHVKGACGRDDRQEEDVPQSVRESRKIASYVPGVMSVTRWLEFVQKRIH